MKILFVMEYDLDVKNVEEARDQILGNIAVVNEQLARPIQAHFITDLPAMKILSVIKSAE